MRWSSLGIVACLLATPLTVVVTLVVVDHFDGGRERPRSPEPIRAAGPAVTITAGDDLPASVRREVMWAQVQATFWCVLSAAVLAFFMVVSWRAMRAHERLAGAAERAADAVAGPRRGRPPAGPDRATSGGES